MTTKENSGLVLPWAMRRALSPSEEQDVLRLLTETADELVLPRPLNFEGWHRCKAHLRTASADNVPPGWNADRYHRTQVAACGPLVMDPAPTLRHCLTNGPAWVLAWLGAWLSFPPNTGLGWRVDRLAHVAIVALIVALGGGIVAGLVGLVAPLAMADAFIYGCLGTFSLLGFTVVTSDTMFLAMGLAILGLSGGHLLSTHPWVWGEWHNLLPATLGLAISMLIVLGALL